LSDAKKRPRQPSMTGQFVPWRLSPVEAGESVRWHCVVDGRWVAVSLGQNDEAGFVIITSSDGKRRKVESYEDALELAKSLRTNPGTT
jgi:hypothetical protein